ncbi:MAG: transcriptional regulator [candidate division Zixibacteria bacterium RBG_16_53_22]|nr:MAG: transcriptional regulator [candidate division Zixibacteria bacterium RBG_16_53_22]
MKEKKTTNALEIIYKRYYKGKPERIASLEQERANAKIARKLYALRIRNKMTQKQLASRVGTTPSVISRLEKADYTGHSLNMIQRIAASFDRQVEVRFVSIAGKRRSLAVNK